MRSPILFTVLTLACSAPFSMSARAANQDNAPEIFFDLPLVTAGSALDTSTCDQLIDVELRLSSMIVAPKPQRIDQWIVRCQPRQDGIQIADYSPRTEVASRIQGPIQVKTTDEKTESFGLSINGTYGDLAKGNAGTDRGSKQAECLQYDRIAPVHAVTASGTINRGRGVYFKLKWTEQQVLEGEKVFHLTLNVPATWRSGLVDVSVIAQSEKKSFGGWDRDVVTLGRANFVVAVYRAGDSEAMAAAKNLADAEDTLRRTVAAHRHSQNPITGLVRNVTELFESKRPIDSQQILEQLLVEGASPHVDKQLLELPVQTRVVALDYCDAREAFVRLNQPEESLVVCH
ncbi:hypothetical protein Q31b_30860 [Novipirellula aureliae]|uniref:Uncharacterized protein n=1 Tax=Novipirellula aureliae TaxID=2527966 RepID=A0A5C6DYF9_9BACT|nr:hypothetical protein [Novipirellula aureliae]TWU41632.1 hypothetical protein Q31b_30860 [Novipirellula aureliae]